MTMPTPDGDFSIVIDKNEVAIVSGFGNTEKLFRKLPKDLQSTNIKIVDKHPYKKLVEEYYCGDKSALSKMPKQQTGSNFQKKVWDGIINISYGKTLSYGQLAKKIGYPKAARAVGTACGLNRLALIIPCHRVIKSDGTIGGYAHKIDIKQSLLERESRINACNK